MSPPISPIGAPIAPGALVPATDLGMSYAFLCRSVVAKVPPDIYCHRQVAAVHESTPQRLFKQQESGNAEGPSIRGSAR